MASAALYRLKPEIVPYLRKAYPKGDQQQKEAIDLIMKDIYDPPSNVSELEGRGKLHSLTRWVHDPAIDYPAHRVSVRGFE